MFIFYEYLIEAKLLERLEDTKTGEVVKDLHVEIPKERYAQAQVVIYAIFERWCIIHTSLNKEVLSSIGGCQRSEGPISYKIPVYIIPSPSFR